MAVRSRHFSSRKSFTAGLSLRCQIGKINKERGRNDPQFRLIVTELRAPLFSTWRQGAQAQARGVTREGYGNREHLRL